MLENRQVLFQAGKNDKQNEFGVASFRIPALFQTQSGILIAGGDERVYHKNDWGHINLVVRRSLDNGDTWLDSQTVVKLQENEQTENPEYGGPFLIDMNFVQDKQTGRLFALYDMYPEERGLFGIVEKPEERPAYIEIEGQKYLALYSNKNEQEVYTVRENGRVYNEHNEKTAYTMIVETNEPPYQTLGDLYHDQQGLVGNVYFMTNSTAPFSVARRSYIWISYSDDDGVSWSCPRDITSQILLPWMRFYGVGPGNAIQLQHGKYAGRLVVPTYSTNHPTILDGSQSSRVIYSDDGGVTWQSGAAVNDGRKYDEETILDSSSMNLSKAQNTESVPVELKNGQIKLFMRNLTGALQVATSDDGGATWRNEVDTYPEVLDVYCQIAAVHYEAQDKEYIVLTNPGGPERTNGTVHVAEVNSEGTLEWRYHRVFQEGKFAYSSIKQIDSQRFGVLFEHSEGEENEYNLIYGELDWDWIMGA